MITISGIEFAKEADHEGELEVMIPTSLDDCSEVYAWIVARQAL